ncbi:hypothetical protein Hanom_Chr09g00780321 [Helianthus anomalus]
MEGYRILRLGQRQESFFLLRITDPFFLFMRLSPCHIFQESLVTKERIEAFWKLDPAIRTFPPRSKDPKEISSTSYTMSSAAKSSKSASRFSVADLQDIASPRSIKKELAASQSNPEPKGMSTRGKGTKKKKPTKSSEGLPLMERQLHDYVSKVRILSPEIMLLLRIKDPDC